MEDIILEKIIELNESEKGLLSQVEGNYFPWYYYNITQNYMIYSHNLIIRIEYEDSKDFNPEHTSLLKNLFSSEVDNFKNFDHTKGRDNSEYAGAFKKLFYRICEENDIAVNNICRMAINASHYDKTKYTDIHIDHSFKHKVFLMYLNDFDAGETYLFDEDDNIIYTIQPQKYKAVIFNGIKHANSFCLPGQKRLVFVATFF